jgi:hypothetical protein
MGSDSACERCCRGFGTSHRVIVTAGSMRLLWRPRRSTLRRTLRVRWWRSGPRPNLARAGVVGCDSAMDGRGGRLVAILLRKVDQAVVPAGRSLPASFYPGAGIFFEYPDCPFAGLDRGRPFTALNQPVDVPLGFSNFFWRTAFLKAILATPFVTCRLVSPRTPRNWYRASALVRIMSALAGEVCRPAAGGTDARLPSCAQAPRLVRLALAQSVSPRGLPE